MCYVNDVLCILIDGVYENHPIMYRYKKKGQDLYHKPSVLQHCKRREMYSRTHKI